MKRLKFTYLKNPSVIIFLSALLSFLGWLIMSEKMFYTLKKPFSLFSIGVALAFVWYFLAVCYVYIGFQCGKTIKIKSSFMDKYLGLDSDFGYKIFVCIACLGSFYSLYFISVSLGGFYKLIDLVKNSQANHLKHSLYKDYSIGIRSLRYVSIHAVTLTIVRLVVFKKKSMMFGLLAVISLIVCALISSRLSIIVTIVQTTIILILYDKISLKPKHILLGGLLFYLTISTLNYTRNYQFYKKHGGMNFFEAGAADMTVYLGAPFQGAVSVGENYSLIRKDPKNWHKYSGIPSSLTTNSTFLYFFRDYDWFCFIVAAFFLLTYSFVAGVFVKFKGNMLILIYTTIMYIFAEFWRVHLFYQGIMIALVVTPLIILLIVFLLKAPYYYVKQIKK